MLITCALFFYAGNAQKVSVAADRTKILIGEQVVLQLKAEDINLSNTTLQDWFIVDDDTSKHINIVKKEKIDTVAVNSLTNYIQKVAITSFDSGRWQLGPLAIVIKDNATGTQTTYKTDSLFIDVLPVDVSSMTDYHPIKDIIEAKAKTNYTLYIAIVFSFIIIAILAWLIVKRLNKKKLAPVKPVYEGTALEQALQQLKKLQQENLPAAGQTKMFYEKLSDISRKYFSKQLSVNVAHFTSDELMVTVIVYLQDEQKRTSFFQLLRLIDVVKFAKYIPGAPQNDEAIESAMSSLQHIDKILKQTRQHDS